MIKTIKRFIVYSYISHWLWVTFKIMTLFVTHYFALKGAHANMRRSLCFRGTGRFVLVPVRADIPRRTLKHIMQCLKQLLHVWSISFPRCPRLHLRADMEVRVHIGWVRIWEQVLNSGWSASVLTDYLSLNICRILKQDFFWGHHVSKRQKTKERHILKCIWTWRN